MSKLVRSREEWRAKAVKRSMQNKELRKANVANRQKIADLKQQVKELEQASEDTKKRHCTGGSGN